MKLNIVAQCKVVAATIALGCYLFILICFEGSQEASRRMLYPALDAFPLWSVDHMASWQTALMVCPGAVLQSMKEGKEGREKPRGARTADKAGWIKKSSGGLLGLWKDRYLLLCQAQLLVYENEVRTCLALPAETEARQTGQQEHPGTGAGRLVLLLFWFGLFGCSFIWFET